MKPLAAIEFRSGRGMEWKPDLNDLDIIRLYEYSTGGPSALDQRWCQHREAGPVVTRKQFLMMKLKGELWTGIKKSVD